VERAVAVPAAPDVGRRQRPHSQDRLLLDNLRGTVKPARLAVEAAVAVQPVAQQQRQALPEQHPADREVPVARQVEEAVVAAR
jgi:hypothetical protein